MALFVLGLLVLFLSFVLRRFTTARTAPATLASWAWTIRTIAIVVMLVGLGSATVIIIPAGYKGVLLQFGAVRGSMESGIHLIIPYVNSVELIEIRTQKETANATAASKDLQIVTTEIALNFHIDPSQVDALYRNVGTNYKDRIIDPAMQESIKMVTAQFTAEELIKMRASVKAKVEDAIMKRLRAYNIIMDDQGLSITNFNFSNEFNAAIEAKQVAQQEAEKQRYVLAKAELERQTVITQAKGNAEAARLNAFALQAQGGSKVLAREWIQKWDGHLPTVAGSGGAGGGVIIDINSLLKDAK
jgi:regulator of protease activity HflC (stomatin/prohibitin superfamily)